MGLKNKKGEKKRSFGGKLIVLKDGKVRSDANKVDRNFENKHLKAYLRGDKYFSFGKDNQHNPMWFKVKENWS